MTKRHVAIAVLAFVALTVAVVGRVTGCEGCEHEVLGVPLFAIGSVYYLALGLLALFGVDPVRIGWVSLPGVAIQAGLVRYLLLLGAPCWTCLAAAAALLTLSIACVYSARRWRFAPGVVAVAGTLALPLWSSLLVDTQRVAGMPEFARAVDLRSPPPDATLVVVYARAECSYCQSFDRDYVPRLAADFGASVVLRRVDADDRRGLGRLPTFLVRHPDGTLTLVRGLPPYADLVAKFAIPKRS